MAVLRCGFGVGASALGTYALIRCARRKRRHEDFKLGVAQLPKDFTANRCLFVSGLQPLLDSIKRVLDQYPIMRIWLYGINRRIILNRAAMRTVYIVSGMTDGHFIGNKNGAFRVYC